MVPGAITLPIPRNLFEGVLWIDSMVDLGNAPVELPGIRSASSIQSSSSWSSCWIAAARAPAVSDPLPDT